MSKSNLNWNERFAIIDKHTPSDDQIRTAFQVTQAELDTARQLRDSGQFTAATDIDADSYASMFSSGSATSTTKPKSTGSKTTTVKPIGDGKPLTATKKAAEPKKRGRKGDKIKNAFAAIPADATPVDTFSAEHSVSLAVLRQGKRFDPEFGTGGRVHVKKVAQDGSDDKVLCIWREAPAD